MNLRTLVNLAYAVVAEGRDEAGIEKLDATLMQADLAMDVAMAQRWRRRPAPTAAPEMTEAEMFELRKKRLLRSVPDQTRQLAGMMGQFGGAAPGAAR